MVHLAGLDGIVSTTMDRVLQKAEHAELKGQRLNQEQRELGIADIKPNTFRHFVLLDKSTQLHILDELDKGDMDIKCFKHEAKNLHKLQVSDY